MTKPIAVYDTQFNTLLVVVEKPSRKVYKWLEKYCIANKKACGGQGLTLEADMLSVLFGHTCKAYATKKTLLKNFPRVPLFTFCPVEQYKKDSVNFTRVNMDFNSGVTWQIIS